MTRRLRTDDRGVSTLVNHILAIGITSILIVGLLTAGSSYIQNQQQFAGQDGLETVGNELARDVTQLLRLSAGDGEATITTELPERIAGRSYSAEVRDGSTCDRLESTPDSCLVLDINGLDITQNVPLSVDESDIELNRIGPGRYQLDYTGSGLGEADADSDVTRLSLRVGIGDDVQQERDGGNIVGQTNLPPTNVSFEMDPEWPDSSRDIEFTADAVDPDATDPGDPGMNYSWDFDSDGTYEVENKTSETATHDYSSYGRKNVTLRVTDERGASTWESKNITVAGLQYVDGSLERTSPGIDGEAVSFNMTNTHANSVEIKGLFFRSLDWQSKIEISAEEEYCDEYEFDYDDNEWECVDWDTRDSEEIRFRPVGTSSWTDLFDLRDGGLEVPESGLVLSAVYGDGPRLIRSTVGAGDSVQVQIRGIDNLPANTDYVLGIEYEIQDGKETINITRFDTRNVS